MAALLGAAFLYGATFVVIKAVVSIFLVVSHQQEARQELAESVAPAR